jgi:hypothetical protein
MGAPESYPSAPPFPHQATHNIGQAHAVAGPDEPETVTLIRDGVHHLLVTAERYLERYGSAGVNRGGVVALHGEHGAGKTHAIWYVMQHLDTGLPRFEEVPKSGSLCQLYAKVDGPDVVQLYRSLISQLGLAQMRELSLAFLAVVAAEQGAGSAEPEHRAAVRRRLRESPDVVNGLFESARLEPGAVREGGAQEIERIGEAWRDFERAVTGLRMSKLGKVAHRWLCGEPLSAEDLDRLGVQGSIDTPDKALLGLRVMARLFRRAEVPLGLYIDQVEGLVLPGDAGGREAASNTGFLRSLIEVLPQEGALVVVAGNVEAWRDYPRDLKQRFADGPVFLPALTEAEAADLIAAYQAPFKPPVSARNAALFPFTADAVPELLRFGGGNTRRFLQNCSLVFNHAFPTRAVIDSTAVRSVLEHASATRLDRAGARARARALLAGRGLSVEEDAAIGGVTVDLAVATPEGRRVAVVKLNEAIFRSQEARDVADSLELVRRAKAEGEVLHVVLVVLGYVSPDMTRMLEEVADDTVVYAAEGFEEAFLAALGRIPTSTPAAPASAAGVEPGALGERIEELQRALIDVLAKRRDDDERVQAQLDALLRRQEEQRAQAGRDEARKTWILERGRLEREIRDARTNRARAEADEMERLRQSVEAARAARQRKVTGLAGTAGVLVLAAVVVLAATGAKGPAGIAVPLLALLAGVVAGYLGWREHQAVQQMVPAALRELAQAVSSEEELYQVVASVPPVGRVYLRSPFPGIRYAAAIASAGGDSRTAEELALALPRERSTIVRRALARSLATADLVDRRFYETHELVGVPEVVYIADLSTSDVGIETSQSFAAVRALKEGDDSSFLRLVLQRELDDLTIMKLSEGHRRGIERLGATMLRDRIPERARRTAIDMLSPFDGLGLGTFDRLGIIHQVDAWYLFFRELQWYSELGWAEWQG